MEQDLDLEVTLQRIQRPHWEHTRRAMTRAPLVLIVHDTTELDFSSHHALHDAGPIGDLVHAGRVGAAVDEDVVGDEEQLSAALIAG